MAPRQTSGSLPRGRDCRCPRGRRRTSGSATALLPLLAEARWGAAGLYRISAVLDGEVERARVTFAQAGAILGGRAGGDAALLDSESALLPVVGFFAQD